MEIILLENFDKLGNIGDTVIVKDGFARNYLLPQKKALRANKENKEYFKKIKNDLEKKNKEAVDNANKITENLKKIKLIFLRQASDAGQLYGSVSPKDISHHLKNENVNVSPSNINLTSAIKKVGIFDVKIKLHAQVVVDLKINVATSLENAELQIKELLKTKKDDTKNIKTAISKDNKNQNEKSSKNIQSKSSTNAKKVENLESTTNDNNKSLKNKNIIENNSSEKSDKESNHSKDSNSEKKNLTNDKNKKESKRATKSE